MGTGNLTELTEADTTGITAAAARHLLGAADPQRAGRAGQPAHAAHDRGARRGAPHHVSPRARTAACPRAIGAGAAARCTTASRSPTRRRRSPSCAAEVRDENYRIEVAEDGIHVYNRDGHHVAARCVRAVPQARRRGRRRRTPSISAPSWRKAEIAWQLGKRYVQDEALDWGVAADRQAEDLTRLAAARRRRCKPSARSKADADDPRNHRDDDERERARCTSRRSALIAEGEEWVHRAVPALDDARQSARGAVSRSPTTPTTCGSSPAA